MPETHKQRLEFERKTSLLEVEALFPTFRVLTITQRTSQINQSRLTLILSLH